MNLSVSQYLITCGFPKRHTLSEVFCPQRFLVQRIKLSRHADYHVLACPLASQILSENGKHTGDQDEVFLVRRPSSSLDPAVDTPNHLNLSIS